jgi:hypothetical protein
MFHMTLCGLLILFFSWLLLHALIYSKTESRIIEGLDPTVTPPTVAPSQVLSDENTAQVAIMKKQIASLVTTATQLNTDTLKNEADITKNTEMIKKVVDSQNATNAKMSDMKKAQ